MSRKLTVRSGGLSRIQATGKDVVDPDNVDLEAMKFFLYKQSNLDVLVKRSQQLLQTLGISTILVNNVLIQQDIFHADSLRNGGFATSADFHTLQFEERANQPNYIINKEGYLIQQHIKKMIESLIELATPALSQYTELRIAGFAPTQAMELVSQDIIDVAFKTKIQTLNLVRPSAIVKARILSTVKDLNTGNSLYNLLVYDL